MLYPGNAVYDLPGHRSSSMVLQWHITERCNLRCTHCYQDQFCADELDFPQLCQIIDQLKYFLSQRQSDTPASEIRGLINVTGGEPFVRNDFFDLLEIFAENRDRFHFGILTNGTLIDEHVARRLRELKTAYVQVSLEGSPKTNDAIRGEGTFNRITAALEHLTAQGIRTMVSFTAHRGNFREFLDVARVAFELNVNRVWADRLIPYGAGMSLENPELTPPETREFFEIMAAAYRESQERFCRTEVFMGRALQFLAGGGHPYRCEAGNRLVALGANGDLYPCRRMPVRIGNLLEKPLIDLYRQSPFLQKLRRHEISSGCASCTFKRTCRGGLKCLSYAVWGNPFVADPGCWRAVDRDIRAEPVNEC